MPRFRLAAFLAAAALGATAAPAQSLPGGLGNLAGGLGGGGGGLAGLLPSIGSTAPANAAGLLGYCVKNRLFGGQDQTAAAGNTLSRLTGQGGLAAQPGFAAGQSGQVVAGGHTLSLAGTKDQLKQKVCDLVLQRARSFL